MKKIFAAISLSVLVLSVSSCDLFRSCPDMRTEYSEPLSGRENISSTGTGILGNSHLRNIFNMQRHAVDGGTEIHKAGKP